MKVEKLVSIKISFTNEELKFLRDYLQNYPFDVREGYSVEPLERKELRERLFTGFKNALE